METMSENQPEDNLLTVAKKNTLSFCSSFSKYANIDDFLHRTQSDFMSTRSVNITFGEMSLLIQSQVDIDGLVLELISLKAIRFPVYYMTLLPRGEISIIAMYPILKKHLDLTQFCRKSLAFLKMSNGIQLFSSNGWQVNLALIPEVNIDTSIDVPSVGNYKKFAYQYFNKIKSTFQNNLLKLTLREMAIDTLKKNTILDVSKWRILKKDQHLILNMLEKTLDACHAPPFHRVSVIAFRFGERDPNQFKLANDFCIEQLTNVTTHIAVTFRTDEDRFHLFWSRDGIQKLIGFRGTLTPALSFRDCCNFQTNLDGRSLDISEELKTVCKFPENIRFLQFYADSPHMHCDIKHPVSGIIGTCNLLHPQSTSNLFRQSEEYISVCLENLKKLGEAMSIRLEIVVSLDEIPSDINADDILSMGNVEKLMETYPMIIPFQEALTLGGLRLSFISLIKRTAEHIYIKLQTLRDEFRGSGKLIPTWEAYQYEICNELFWRGKLNSYTDSILSRNLGPGNGQRDRSLSFQFGFMCLECSTECALDEKSPPPLHHWTNSKLQTERIKRLFSFGDFLSCNDTILGTRAVLLLIEDIKNNREEKDSIPSLTHDLRQETVPSWASCIVSISAEQLCNDLSRRDLFRFPFTFGRALELMKGEGRNIGNILLAGLNHLHMNYFPYYRIRYGFKWTNFQVFKILYPNSVAGKNTYDVRILSANIICELENENLVFRSRFVNAVSEFPWVLETCKRLGGMELSREDLLRVLTFMTCVCLIQNGYYVNFSSLFTYMRKMPLTQHDLQMNKVLSVFYLRGPLSKRIYHIYEDIPHKFEPSAQMVKSGSEPEENLDEIIAQPLDAPINHEQTEEQNVQHVPPRHMPARLLVPWNQFEIKILDDIIKRGKETYQIMYTNYVQECEKKGIPDRTFNAFRAAILRTIKKTRLDKSCS